MSPSTSNRDRDESERLARLEERLGAVERRVRGVETVVFGFAGAVLLAVLATAMSFILRSGGASP